MEGKTFHRLDGVYRLVADPVIRQRVGRAGLFTTVLLVVFGLVTSAALPQFTLGETGSASANRLWSSGAELNTTTANVEITSTSGTVSINSSTKRSGDYSFRANPTSSTGIFTKIFANSNQSNKFWFRTYVRIADDPSADTYIVRIGNSGGGKISVRLTTTSTLQLRNEEDNTNIGSASSALSVNTWYRVEVYVDTTTLSSTDAELRLDGTSISSSTAENLASGIDRLTWGSTATGTTDLYFDDIAINDSTGRAVDNWPGEGRIVHMHPNADGSNTAWIGDPSDTNDYDDVDEVTPNDDTDFIRSQTNNQLDDNNLEAATSAGIGANDAIKLVSVGVRIRPCGNASGGGPACPPAEIDINWEARITGGGNTEQSGSIAISDASGWITNDDDSAKLNKITLYDLPGASTAPWTVAELDSAQIGVANRDSSGTGFRVSTTWLQVEYVDRSGGRLISSGFELNSATAGMEVSAVTNTPAINSTTFRSGAYALQTENGGGQEYARFYFESANTNGDYYLRAYLNIATSFNNSTATVLSLLDTSNLRRAYLKLTTTNTLELWDEDGQIGSASSALSTSTWYRIELRLNTVPSGGSHVVDGRIDGVSFASSSTRNVGTGVARIGLGVNASDNMEASANTQGSLIWDDIALNKGIGATQNTWPGAGSIIHLRPDAVGVSTSWTQNGSCAVSNFGCVLEVTPNDGTNYVSETTSDDVDDYNIDNSPLSGSDVVNLVSVGVRFRTSSATQEDFRVRLREASTGIAIESNTLSPASTTWTTNATADPKLYPLTAYTRPELPTIWTDTQLDTAQIGIRDVLSSSGTVQVTAMWLLVDYSPPATIVISGTCDQYNRTTDCTDDGSNQIRVAVNGSLQAQVDTTVDGAWAISGVTQPSSGDIITVFIDGNADTNEAVAVTKYDGTGDISGIVLYQRHLTLGSDDNPTLSNADIDAYDNSVSGDEDIFFDVDANDDLTVDAVSTYTDEYLYVKSGTTYRPGSGGSANVNTTHIEIDGTLQADSNALNINGNWQNDGTFTSNTSTVTMNSTSTGRTLAGAMTGSSAFYDLTFNGSGGAWSFSAAAETDRDFIITAGSVTAPSGNLTVARNFTNNGTFTHNSGTVVLDTTTTATITSASGGTTFNNFTSTAATKTIQFTKHTTGTPVFTFAGTFTITGTSGNLINVYSDTNGTQWKAHFNSNQTSVTYANIRDGGCNTGTANVFLGTDSTSAGNNDTCWVFPINRLWSGGAELQSATAGVETNFNDGSSQSISTSIKRSGEASWRVNTTSSLSAFNKYFVNTPTQGKYWVRIYLYIATSPSARHNILNLNGAARRIGVRLNTSNQLELWNEEDNLQIGSASSALSTATWYRIELHADTTTLSSTSAELRLNGSTTASGTANLAAAFDRIQFGVMDTSSTSDLYFDDIAINGPSSASNNWPGEGKIVHMQPNADGDNVAWADSGGNSIDYDEVDEIPPDDDSTYIHSSSAGNLEDLNLESASSAGIGASDTITAVSVGLRFQACNSGGPACLVGAGDNYKARLKATGGGTVEESASINADNGAGYATNRNSASANANLYPLTLLDLPGSSVTKWTPSDLDTAQIGMRHDTYENGFRTTTMWLLVEYIPVTNVTGTCDQYDRTTDCVDDGSNQIKVAVNGTLQPGADTTVDGSWSVGITQPNTGDIITVFIDGNADNNEAVAVTKYDGTGDITGVLLYQRHLTIGSDDNQTITNANLASYDNSVSGDEDIFFDVDGNNDLIVDAVGTYTDEYLFIKTGNIYRPDSSSSGNVSVTHLEIDGTITADGNAFSINGNWQNDGTFSAGTSTTTFTSTTTGRTIAGTISGTTGKFYNLIFNGTGGEWTNSAALEVANDLTMTAGTLAGTNNVTVVGHTQGTSGVINRTGGTFKQGATASKNFGTTSGTTAWTFSDLTFANDLGICTGITYTTQTGGTGGITVSGILRVGESGDGVGCTTTLNAGDRTWTLSGITGDPFQLLASPAGSLTAATSTFSYTGNDGLGNTTIQSTTYYNLTINNSAETFVLEGTTNVGNDLMITNGTLDTTTSNHSMSITRDVLIANTATATFRARGSTITVSRHWSKGSSGVFTRDSSTVQLNGDGEIQTVGGGQTQFEHLVVAYSGKTTTMATSTTHVFGTLTVNEGTLTCSITCTFQLFRTSGADLSINTSATLTGSNATFHLRKQSASTVTIAGATNYGTWNILAEADTTGVVTFNVGGAITTSGYLWVRANTSGTGSNFNTQNYAVSAKYFLLGDATDNTAIAANFGSSNTTFNNGTGDGFYVASNGGAHTLNLSTSSTTVTGNVKFGNGTGTITVDDGSSTFTFAPSSGTATYSPDGETLYNVIVNGGATVSPDGAVIIANDLTMTAGTLSGTQNITVNGTVQGTAGIINLTGGTFEQRVLTGGTSKNFGTTSGSNAWSFNDLIFSNGCSICGSGGQITTQTGGDGDINVSGILMVGKSGDGDDMILDAGNRTWNLTNANHADPFQLVGPAPNLVPATSTFRYIGDNDTGSVTVQSETYCNLVVGNATAGETYVLEGATSTTAEASCGDLTINTAAIGSNTLDVVSGSNYALNIGGSYTNNGNFNSQNGTVTFTSTTSGKTLNGQMTGSNDDFYNLVFDGVSGAWTFNAAVDVANDFTVTNGSVTANGNNLTVTRDFTLANTSGVSYVAGTTTITVSRHYTDLGSKFSAGTSTLTMNGTGALDHANAFAFYNLNLAYSGFTTTMGTSKSTRVSNDATLNGGTMTGSSTSLEFPSTTTNTPLTFNSPTTLNGTGFNIIGYGANTASITVTIGSGDYGNWNLFFFASANNVAHNFGGNVTTTAHSRFYAGGAVTGLTLNTQGHNFTSGSFRLGSGGATQTVSANFGASAVTFTSTVDAIDAENTGGTYNLDLGSSTVDVKGNVLFLDGSGSISVTPGTSTLKWTHTSGTKTYTPNGQSLYNMELDASGGVVQSTAAVDVNNNFTVTAGTYDLNFSGLTIGGNYSNSGTFTATTATVTFDATDTGNTLSGTMTGSSAFWNVVFNGTGGEWTVNASLKIDNDLTMTAGTFLGAQDITVAGNAVGTAGIINLSGGTFDMRPYSVSPNFGTTSGSTAWTFNNLSFSSAHPFDPKVITTNTGGTGGINVSGTMTIGKVGDSESTTLNAGNRTWTLSGTSGDPFQILASPAGDLTPETSTFTYTGNNGSGDTTIQSETYNILQVNNGSETFNLEAATFSSDVTITAGTLALNGQTLNATNDLAVNGTLSGSTNVTVNGSVTGSGTINLSGGTFTQRITANANETFGSTSGTNNWTFNNLLFRNSDTNNHSITVNPTGSGQIIVGATATFGSGTDTNTVTVDFDTNDRILDVNGSVDITTLGILEPSSSASFTVGDNWTNNGTVTFDTTTTATFAGATTFYNFTSTTAAKTLEFTSGQTFTIDTGGLLTLTGAADPNEIQIKSTTPTSQWFINHQGTESVSYVQVVDSGCDVASTQISTSNSVNDGNNGSCWLFGSTFEQADYRFGEDPEDSSTGIDYSGPAENTAYTSPGTSDGFRLRMLIHVGGSNLAQNGETFKLQFGEKTAANCTTGVSWADVSPSSGVIRYLDAAPADGDNISSVAGDPDHSGHTKQYQDFEEANNFTNSVSAINSGQDGVWAFSLVNHSAVGGKRYCFKAVKSTGADLDTYSFYPEVIIDEELVFSLDATSKNFGVVQPGDNPTNQTSTVTVTTNSATGYVVYTWSTQAMTKGAHTIPDWSGTNASPTSFPNGSFGFGYSTDDSTLTGGTADRFTNGGAKYAGFIHNGPGDPVADRTSGPVVNEQNTITYRLAGGVGQQAGTYTTVVVYVVATTF